MLRPEPLPPSPPYACVQTCGSHAPQTRGKPSSRRVKRVPACSTAVDAPKNVFFSVQGSGARTASAGSSLGRLLASACRALNSSSPSFQIWIRSCGLNSGWPLIAACMDILGTLDPPRRGLSTGFGGTCLHACLWWRGRQRSGRSMPCPELLLPRWA